jgi:HSP20 family protein
VTLLALLHTRILLPAAPASRAEAGACAPSVDVAETPSAVVVQAELPGTDASTLRIAVEANELVLDGVKGASVPAADQGRVERVLRVERPAGAFRRRVRLPCAVDPARGRAHLDAGVLTIVLPRVRAEA